MSTLCGYLTKISMCFFFWSHQGRDKALAMAPSLKHASSSLSLVYHCLTNQGILWSRGNLIQTQNIIRARQGPVLLRNYPQMLEISDSENIDRILCIIEPLSFLRLLSLLYTSKGACLFSILTQDASEAMT